MPIQQAPFPPTVVNQLALTSPEQEELKNFLQKLVQTPSLSGKESDVAALIKEKLIACGVKDVTIDPLGNVVASIGNASAGLTLLFNAHMDTVDTTGERWPHPPYAGIIEDGVLYGRGACDMKGAAAAMVFAAKRLVESDTALVGRVIFLFVVQHEPCEGHAMQGFVEESGVTPDFVVLTEPSNLQLMRGQLGRVMLKVTVHGKSSHASVPQLGKNAIMAATRLIFGIDMAAADIATDPFLGRGSVVVTKIESEAASLNTVPDRCTFYVDRRLTVGESPNRAVTEVESAIAREDINADVEIMMYSHPTYTGYPLEEKAAFDAWVLETEHPLVKFANTAAFMALGTPPQISHWAFSTDGVYSMAKANIPTVGFGPGDPNVAHTVDEHIHISDVVKAAHVYGLLTAIVLKGMQQ